MTTTKLLTTKVLLEQYWKINSKINDKYITHSSDKSISNNINLSKSHRKFERSRIMFL